MLPIIQISKFFYDTDIAISLNEINKSLNSFDWFSLINILVSITAVFLSAYLATLFEKKRVLSEKQDSINQSILKNINETLELIRDDFFQPESFQMRVSSNMLEFLCDVNPDSPKSDTMQNNVQKLTEHLESLRSALLDTLAKSNNYTNKVSYHEKFFDDSEHLLNDLINLKIHLAVVEVEVEKLNKIAFRLQKQNPNYLISDIKSLYRGSNDFLESLESSLLPLIDTLRKSTQNIKYKSNDQR